MKTKLVKTVMMSVIGAFVCLGLCFTPVDTVSANDGTTSTESSEEPATVEADGLGGINVQIDPSSGNVVIDGLDDEKGSAAAWNTVLVKYKGIISGVSAVITLTMVVLFLVNLVKVASSNGNPNAKTSALSGLLWTGIATAGVGAVDIFLAIFYNALR